VRPPSPPDKSGKGEVKSLSLGKGFRDRSLPTPQLTSPMWGHMHIYNPSSSKEGGGFFLIVYIFSFE